MKHKAITLILLICLLVCPLIPLQAQNILVESYGQFNILFKMDIGYYTTRLDYPAFSAINNKLLYLQLENDDVNYELLNLLTNIPKVDEAKMIRESWKKVFGFDVWYPYYKAKEVEEWVKERLSIRIFKLKGKPKFEKNRILYVFKTTF